jgi:hypothetical protein
MNYSNTDIILCFSGVGRSFYYKTGTNSSFALDLDFEIKDKYKFVDEIIETKKLKRYRYILLPMDIELKEILDNRGIAYAVVLPNVDEMSEWIRRWWKSNSTAEQIASRMKDYFKYRTEDAGGKWNDVPTIILKSDEWIGNVLSQNPNEVAKE